MIFITTFNKDIYDICGRNLIQSFVDTKNNIDHKLVLYFEDDITEQGYLPEWLYDWTGTMNIYIANVMSKGDILEVDKELSPKISHTDEYSSPRSVKWFRPVSAIKQVSEITVDPFCSIDSDCLFTSKVEESFFDEMKKYNVSFLGRENFKVMRHGAYTPAGEYIHTITVPATNKDTHTETGFILFNLKMEGTQEFIDRNFEYWTKGRILDLEFKTDCHTFDAVRKEMPELKYNNLCDPMGDTSPIGSRVIEDSVVGSFLIHHKGTIGPILYQKNLLKK
jgi:hypothetical protein